MKKSLSRLLSLALVLVMVVGMVPAAMATGGSSGENSEGGFTVDVTGLGTKYYVGDTINVELTGLETDCVINNIVWAFDGATGTDPKHTYTAALNTGATPNLWSGNTVVTYTPLGSAEQETATVSFATNVYSRVESIAVENATGKVGEEVALTAAVLPETAVQTVTWSVTGDNKADASITADGKFTATKAGTYTVEAVSDDPEKKATATVTIEDVKVEDCQPKLNLTEVELKVAETKTLEVTFEPKLPENVKPVIEFKSDDEKVAKVDKTTGKIEAVAEGMAKITATVKVGELAAKTLECKVTVKGGVYLTCKGVNVSTSGYDYLEPKAVGVPDGATVTYSLKSTSNQLSIAANGRVSGSVPGVYTVTVSAYYVPKGEKDSAATRVDLDPINVYVAVYGEHVVEVNLKADVPSTIKFTDEKLFTSAKYDEVSGLQDKSLQYILSEEKGYKIAFTEAAGSDNIGTWYTDSVWKEQDECLMANLSRATLTLNGRPGTLILNYTITTDESYGELVVAKGVLKITVGETTADITYKTSFSGKVTVNEADFAKFFNDYVKKNKMTTAGELNYVMFDIDAKSPEQGFLYTKVPTVSTKDLAVARDQFFYKYTSADNGYDLDTVTYVPNSLATKAYVDTVAFTCYSTTGAKVSGILSFEVGSDMTFTDVKKGDYFYDAVVWAVDKGITTGTSATTFSPNNACTRGQVVTFLWRAAGEPAAKISVNPFTDVKTTDYYYDAVLWAVGEGITTGLSATTFGPNQACTRAQVVTFLYRAFDEPTVAATTTFTDVKSSDYFAKAVAWAVKNGVTTGLSATSFGPGNACTRGQIVTFLYRAYEA